jgi:hypothetical protein
MARRERRKQPRIPVEVDVSFDPRIDSEDKPVHLQLRTRNLNTRGAFIELPVPGNPPPPWAHADWWTGRQVLIHVNGSPLAENGQIECLAEVRWVERRGPKRRPIGIGVLFLTPSEDWLNSLQRFLDSLMT